MVGAAAVLFLAAFTRVCSLTEVQVVKVDSWAEALVPLQAVTSHTNFYKVTWVMFVEGGPAVTHACRPQQPGPPGASGASPRGRGRGSRGSEASGSSSIWMAVWKNVAWS